MNPSTTKTFYWGPKCNAMEQTWQVHTCHSWRVSRPELQCCIPPSEVPWWSETEEDHQMTRRCSDPASGSREVVTYSWNLYYYFLIVHIAWARPYSKEDSFETDWKIQNFPSQKRETNSSFKAFMSSTDSYCTIYRSLATEGKKQFCIRLQS